MKNKKIILLLATFFSLITCGCGPNNSPSSITSNVEVVKQNVAPTYFTEGKIYEYNEDGSIKETILPILNDTNYNYSESEGVATFAHENGYVTSRIISNDILKIDDKTYNNVNCHFARIENLDIRYEIDRYYLTVPLEKVATIKNIEAKNIELLINGTLNASKIKSEILVVKDGSTINLTNENDYALYNNLSLIEPKAKININIKNHVAVAVNGTMQAYGEMYVKNIGSEKVISGIEFIGSDRFFRVIHSSRITIDGFEMGIYQSGGSNTGRITRPGDLDWVTETENGPTSNYPGQKDAALPCYGKDENDNYYYLIKVINCTYRWNCPDKNN